MKRLALATGLGLCALVLAGGMAAAKPAGEQAGARFEQLDTNADQMLSRSELGEARNRIFRAADENGDGRITLQELTMFAQEQSRARAERMMARLDRDGDGALSSAEMQKRGREDARFDRIDRDGDGLISKSEFETGWNFRSRATRHQTGRKGADQP